MPTPGMPGESKRSDSRATQLRADFHQNGRRMSARGFGAAGEASETASEAPAGGGVRKVGLQDVRQSTTPTSTSAFSEASSAPSFLARRGDGVDSRAQMARTVDKLTHGKTVSARIAVRWCLDRDAHVCFGCREEFSTFTRKHHCRACGGVFCNSCSRWLKSLPLMGYDDPVRVCGYCFHESQGVAPPSSAGSTLARDEEEQNEKADDIANSSENDSQMANGRELANGSRRPLSSLDGNRNGSSDGRQRTASKKKTRKNKRSGSNRRKTNSFDLSAKALAQLNASAQQQQLSQKNGPAKLALPPSFRAFSQVAPAWVDDSESNICQQCSVEFGILFARRHHCRGCGGLFCWTCTQRRLALPHFGYVSPVRVCVSCSSPQILSTTLVPTQGGRLVITGRNLSDVAPLTRKDGGLNENSNRTEETNPGGDENRRTSATPHRGSRLDCAPSLYVSVDVQLDGRSTVRCTDVKVLIPGQQISCKVPAGAGQKCPLRVTVNGLRGVSTFSFAGPEITKTSAVSTAGGELIVTGTNFGADPDLILVQWFSRADQNWHACEQVELLAAHSILRCLVGPGVGSTAMLSVTVAGVSTRTTYTHAPPVILDVTPVSAAGGVIEIVGLNFGGGMDEAVENALLCNGDAKAAARKENLEGKEDLDVASHDNSVSGTLNQAGNSRVITIEIDGVQCQGVQVVTAHTKIRCVAPRMSRLQQYAIEDEDHDLCEDKDGTARREKGGEIRKGERRRRRRPHLTPPNIQRKSKGPRNQNNRSRSNSGDELRLLVVRVGDLCATSEVTYINEAQANAFMSARGIEDSQDRGTSKRKSMMRPASTPPRGATKDGSSGRSARAPWMPDEHVTDCMLRCGTKFGFFTRKHHCRNCGIVVCAGCSKHTQYVEAYKSVQRVCRRCYRAAVTKDHRESMLKHRLEHIATMQSIEVGKKARFERDLSILRLQAGSSPDQAEEIVRLEALVEEQDRRIAGKQNEFNRIQQRILNLTVNGLDESECSPVHRRASASLLRRDAPSKRSMSTSSASASPSSFVPSMSTPTSSPSPRISRPHHHRGHSAGSSSSSRARNGDRRSLVRPNSVVVMADRHAFPSSASNGEEHTNLSPSPSFDDRSSSSLRRVTSSFSGAPASGLLRPISSPSKSFGGGEMKRPSRIDSMLEAGDNESTASPPPPSSPVRRIQTFNGRDISRSSIISSSSSSPSPRKRAGTDGDSSRDSRGLGGGVLSQPISMSSAQAAGTKYHSNSSPNQMSSKMPPMSPPDSEGRTLLASGLLRGRALSDYAICTFSASPERSWVGASRNQRMSNGSLSLGERPMSLNSSQNLNESPESKSSSGSSTGLAGWVARRLSVRGGGTRRRASSSVPSDKSSKRSRNHNSASMLVAVHRGNKCVLKELSMGDQETRQRIEREVAIRGMLTEPVHPNIAPLEAIFYEKDIGKMYIHYDLVEVGNLADWLAAGAPQPWDIQSVFQQLAGTLVYLHQHQIVHRSLSLDGVLIGIQGDAHGELPKPYVTDFGDALIVPRTGDVGLAPEGGESKSSGLASSSGNLVNAMQMGSGDQIYRAPEVSAGAPATPAADMWALGVMMYKATFGLHLEPVGLGGRSVPIPPHRNARLRNLIKSLLCIDPRRRLTAIGAVVHPYFTMSLAAEMHQAGNVIDPDEKLSLFRRHLTTMQQASHNEGVNSEAIQFIHVRRESVVRDVLREFARYSRANLEKRLIVMYEGESGVDAGGLTKDLFYRFFEQLVTPAIGMFCCTDEGSGGSGGGASGGGFVASGERTYLPSPTFQLIGFLEALGKVMAKVVLDGHTINARFAPAMYKYILCDEDGSGSAMSAGTVTAGGKASNDVNGYNSIGFADLEAFDGQLFAQLHENVLQHDITPEYAEALALDFDELVPDGAERIVTNANKREYLRLRARYILIDSRRRQLEAIRRGFHSISWGSSLKRFNALDFRKLLCGPDTLTADMVIGSIDFTYGDWRGSRTLEYVKRFLRDCEAGRVRSRSASKKRRHRNGDQSDGSLELRRFLRFVTGSPNLPYGGLSGGGVGSGQAGATGSATGKICFTRLGQSDRLPEAHTCFNTVDMPDYRDYETLRDKLIQSIDNDDGKFDLV